MQRLLLAAVLAIHHHLPSGRQICNTHHVPNSSAYAPTAIMSISRQALFGKLGKTVFKSIESATAFCKLRGNPYVELAHWLKQLLQQPDSDLHRIMRQAGLDRGAIEREFDLALDALPSGATSITDFSHHVELAIERAWVISTLAFGDRRIRGAWLVMALMQTPELRRLLVAVSPTLAKLPADTLEAKVSDWISGSPEADDPPYDGSALAPALPGEAANALATAGKQAPLDQYCVDLTAKARAGEIDPVVGRGLEIRTVTDVLLRRRQNNPLLTGDAGVGKTAVVEGLALAIACGDVPPKLADARILSLDVGALLAGASMKGEFESRLKGVLEGAARSSVPIILFIDEIHTLIGAGGQAGTGDAANLLKPALARGAVRTIGATTWAEYKRHIEKDPALIRRFQVLQVAEPVEAAAVDMIRGLTSTFEQHHGVPVLDEAIRAAVSLSHRYMPARQLPDKAISLLDTACARVALSQHAAPRELQRIREQLAAAATEHELLEKEARMGRDVGAALAALSERIAALIAEASANEQRWRAQRAATCALLAARKAHLNESGATVDAQAHQKLRELQQNLATLQDEKPLVFAEVNEAVVADVVSDWTGIPVRSMVTDEIAVVQRLTDTLAARVVGQQHALREISDRVQAARAGLADPGKPQGVFLLTGPSGVGKTETALALAEALYGGEQNLITVNMSEYQEAHTVSGLKGAPPGYVGHGEGGVLTEAVRRRPYSVVLLDEIEKAHRDVHEMFFQVFDKGYMEDGDGRYIDFRHTIILLTSNVGAELSTSLCSDPVLAPDMAVLRDALAPELLKAFPTAFLGRVSVVPFRPLADAALVHIVRLHLNRVAARMASSHDIELAYSNAVVDYITQRCLVQETGARVLIGFIEQHILPRLSARWFESLAAHRTLTRIHIDVTDFTAAPAAALIFNENGGYGETARGEASPDGQSL
jgi:type VI secretion system protein VasG